MYSKSAAIPLPPLARTRRDLVVEKKIMRSGIDIFDETFLSLRRFIRKHYTVVVAQPVRASDCGSEGRGFEPHLPPRQSRFDLFRGGFFSSAKPNT